MGALIAIIAMAVIGVLFATRAPGQSALAQARAGKAGAANRSTVSFENPLYDEQGQAAGGNPGDSGLYDAPAFEDPKRANPMYNSTDDIDDDDDDEDDDDEESDEDEEEDDDDDDDDDDD